MLEFLEAVLTHVCPLKWNVVLEQLCHWLCNLGEVLNESPVVTCQSEKASDFCDTLWLFPFCHCLNLFRIHYYAFSCQHVAQKGYFLQPELALAELPIELMLPQLL